MRSLLKTYYPSLQLDKICRKCCGMQITRCSACGKTKLHYKKDGLEREIEEMAYLRLTWQKVRNFKQISTGIKKLDNLITVLFGKPHDSDWRNYSKQPGVNMDEAIVLRISHV